MSDALSGLPGARPISITPSVRHPMSQLPQDPKIIVTQEAAKATATASVVRRIPRGR